MKPVLIGLDAGTSVIKAVAFDGDGHQVDSAAVRHPVRHGPNGRAEQGMAEAWAGARDAIAALVERNPSLKNDIQAIAVTGQGDGTWLIDRDGAAIEPAIIWMDGRASSIAAALRRSDEGAELYRRTASGVNQSIQSCQLKWLAEHEPERLARASAALHCKDWIYYCLTGWARTDWAEGTYTFGNYQTGDYDPEVLRLLGLSDYRHLLPEMAPPFNADGRLSAPAAEQTGLPEGATVVLAPVDMVTSALGTGVYRAGMDIGCTMLGSAGVNARVVATESVHLGERQGYTMPFLVDGRRLQLMTHMAATLNIEWLANLVTETMQTMGASAPDRDALYATFDRLVEQAAPGQVLYAPFISANGERMPFFNPDARAQVIGLEFSSGLSTLVRAVYESLALAAADCYAAIGGVPRDVRAAGGAMRSQPFRRILASMLDRPVRPVTQEEATAAGAAFTAAVALGHYDDLDTACAEWVNRHIGEPIDPDPAMRAAYRDLPALYRHSYEAMESLWPALAHAKQAADPA